MNKFYLSTINRTLLTPTEKAIINEMTSYMKGPDPIYTREEGLHISSFMDDFLDEVKPHLKNTEAHEGYRPDLYPFTQQDIERFCNKFGIDTNWETNQQLFI